MNLRSVPAYSMGTKSNQFNKWIQTPGVGNYNMDHKNVTDVKNPNFSFGRNDKLKQKDITPKLVGPGKYETNTSTMGKKLATPLKEKRGQILHTTNEYSPGPGTHDPTDSVLVDQPKYSFRRDRLKTLTCEKITTGPADYNLNYSSVEGKISNGRFGRELNKSTIEMSPGPGQYDWEKSPIQCRKAKFSRDSRRPPSHGVGCTGNVGPGNYMVTQEDLVNNKKKSMGYTMRPKTNQFNKWIQPPGPGNYDPDDLYKSRGFRLPRTARMDLFNQAGYHIKTNPGPGAYCPKSYRSTKEGNVFGNENRPGFADQHSSCGPGQYDWTKTTADTNKYSFKRDSRKGFESLFNFPGPGAYKTQDTKVRKPNYSLGKSRKGFVEFDENPGAGTHDPSFSSTRKKANTGHSFSRDDRMKKIKPTPGPGDHNVKRTVPDIPSYLTKSIA